MPAAERVAKDRARLVCTRCHDRKVRCDLQDQPSGRCRNCQRDQQECRRRVGTRKKLPQYQESPVPSSPSQARDGEEPGAGPGPTLRPEPPRTPIPTSYPTPGVTTTPSQHPSGFIGDLSVLSCPSDPEPVIRSRVEPLPEDVTTSILQLTKAILMPPKSMAQALVDVYFRELQWIVPVVCRSEITGPDPSLLLLQSVYFAGGLMRRSKTWPPSSSPEECYKNIKTLLFVNFEQDKSVILKTLCFLSIWSANGPQSITLDCPWHWNGMAIRLALQFGMHREATHANGGSGVGSSRRLWWFLFCNETLQATCYGRPAMIRRQDFDVALPTLDNIQALNVQSQASIQLPRLLVNLSSIETLNTQRTPVFSDQLQSIITSLRLWIDQLSDDIQLHDRNGKRNPYNRAVSEIYIFYFVCIILVYLLPGAHRNSPLLCSASIVASSCIARLYEEILCHEDVPFLLSIHGWVNLVAAVPQIYCIAKFPSLNSVCDEELSIITSVLSELHTKYPSAGPVIRKIARFRQSGIAFSGLSTTALPDGPAAQSGSAEEAFHDILALLSFPDTLSPKMSLLRPAAVGIRQNLLDPNFMPFNVDEMTWTFDWLESNMNDLDPNGLWSPIANPF